MMRVKLFNSGKKRQQEVEINSRVEIVAHKKATKKEIIKVNKANEALNSLFDDNHFTVKLVLSAKEH